MLKERPSSLEETTPTIPRSMTSITHPLHHVTDGVAMHATLMHCIGCITLPPPPSPDALLSLMQNCNLI